MRRKSAAPIRSRLRPPRRKHPRILIDLSPWFQRRLYRALGFLLKHHVLRSYVHIGMKHNQTHQGGRGLLAGRYAGCSIFEPRLITYLYRRAGRFLLLTLIRGNRLCLISKDFSHHFHRNHLLFPGQFVALDYWISGAISNFSKLINQSARQKVMVPFFPQAVLMLKMDPDKTYNISKECHKAGVPALVCMDSNMDPALFSYYLPTNLKSGRALVFLITFISQIIKRVHVFRRADFVKNVFK